MDLIVHELDILGLRQKIKVTENLNVTAIRPHVYKHGNPAGSVKIQIQDENGYLISESNSISISTISSAIYFHGYVRFLINASLLSDMYYYIRMVGVGYTFSESDFIGWCTDFDLRKVDTLYSPNSGVNSALDMEIWQNKKVYRL